MALQKQEDENQKKANKHWQPLLEKYRDGLAGKDKSRRASAEKGLAEVTDPLAVPAVWVTFANGNAGAAEGRCRRAGTDRFAGSIAGAGDAGNPQWFARGEADRHPDRFAGEIRVSSLRS